MGHVTKYTDFYSWLDECIELGYQMNEIKEDYMEYYFEAGGYKMAYWDRERKFGYISFED